MNGIPAVFVVNGPTGGEARCQRLFEGLRAGAMPETSAARPAADPAF